MSQDKTLPGASFRFASVSSSGSHTNEFGVGEMSLGFFCPGTHWPQIDLGEIYFSEPTQEQYDKAADLRNKFGEEGRHFPNIMRRISRKQADYVSHLICDMLADKFKSGMPADDEIDEIMRVRREANYPVNRKKREQEKKYELTEEQNKLFGQLTKVAHEKIIRIELSFYDLSETGDPAKTRRGSISFSRPGGNFVVNFEGEESFCDAMRTAIYYIGEVKPAKETTKSVRPQFPPNRIESEDHTKFSK